MEFTYSTLFNIDYIDKGIALCNSIRRYNQNSRIYILCLDDPTIKVLNKIGIPNAILIPLQKVEAKYPYLLELKKGRSFAEYCWTLTPHIIEYVLSVYSEGYNTYLDSDLYFWSDPDELNIEMIAHNCDTIITEHRFPATKKVVYEKRHGKYCVQYNTFANSIEGRRLLTRWKEDVILDCEYNKKEGKAGDQKYLEKFPKLSESVFIPDQIGIGVAPWNISRYSFVSMNNGKIKIRERDRQDEIVFYHFQNVKYITRRIVNIGAGRVEKRLKMIIYIPYLMEIDRIRQQLKSYGITPKPRSVSRNRVLSKIQRYLMRFKIRGFSLSDIVYLPEHKRV